MANTSSEQHELPAKSPLLRSQWGQLLALTLVHFVVDMSGGTIPVILPELRRQFGLSLTVGIAIVTLVNITCNGVQLITGHLRAEKRTPFFLYIGVALASAIFFVALLPVDRAGVIFLFLLCGISGIGIAVVHPEGLRAAYSLERLPPAIVTSVFMMAGFMGFAGGPLAAAVLLWWFGLKGLLFLLICSVAALLLLMRLPIRLAVGSENQGDARSNAGQRSVSFWLVMVMTLPVATASTLIISLLPTALDELGFTVYFGGISNMALGVGQVAGALFWAFMAHKRTEASCATLALFLGTPFLAVHSYLIGHWQAVFLLLPAGFCALAAFPLLVTLARYSKGPNLGRRMALVVGGSCGLASLVLFAVGPLAERFGTVAILRFAYLGYFLAALAGLYIMHVSARNEEAILS